MTDYAELIRRERERCIDWDKTEMMDGEEPRSIPTCGETRELADALESLMEENQHLAEYWGNALSAREAAIKAEYERLRTAAETLLAEWDENGPEKWREPVDGDELMFTGYWSPAGRMLETSVVANLRAALERKPE